MSVPRSDAAFDEAVEEAVKREKKAMLERILRNANYMRYVEAIEKELREL